MIRVTSAAGLVALVLGVLASACGRTEPFDREDAPRNPEVPGTARRDLHFTGLWLVDQPYHALYEATWYNFRPDGELLMTKVTGLNPHLAEHGQTGSVARTFDGEPSCVFVDPEAEAGNTWWNTDDFTLVILGACSDDQYREIALEFGRKPGLGVDLGEPNILSVGDEENWVHDNFDWRFKVCDFGQNEDQCAQ